MNRKFFSVPHILKLFFLVGLAVVVHFAYVTSFFVAFGFDFNFDSSHEYNYDAYMYLSPFITVTTILLADYLQMPRFFRKKNLDVVSQTLSFAFIQTLLTFSMKDLSEQRAFPRSVLLISFLVLIVYVFIWEMFCCFISHRMYNNGQLCIIGTNNTTMGEIANKIAPSLKSLDLTMGDMIKFNDTMAVRQAIRSNSEIFICPDVPADSKSDIIMRCAKQNTVAYLVPQFFEISLYKSRMINFNDMMVFMLDRLTLTFEQRTVKRIFDIVVSILALILTSPIILISMLIIKITSPGNAMFTQTRVTQGMKEFTIYKLRTMGLDAEAKTGAIISGKNDPRVTKFGKFLRRSKIDELPQFWNVLKGEMSVVGPRAERPVFVKQFNEEIAGYSQRFSVKAGITGLAQVAGNYDTTPQDKLRYDLLYIKNYSLLQDLKIMFLTVRAVFSTHLYNNLFRANDTSEEMYVQDKPTKNSGSAEESLSSQLIDKIVDKSKET
ncbi:MAG: sugar transferase [Clostridia bacterium]|nr:sugar transferase [Clostridia bacterium]